VNAKDLHPLDAGMLVGITGESGSGKSHFLRTAAQHVLAKGRKVFVVVAPPEEAVSYAGLDLDYEPIEDTEWQPSAQKFEANGLTRFWAYCNKIEKAENVGLIGLDTASELQFSVSRAILGPQRKTNPRDTSDPFAFYTAFRYRMGEVIDRLRILRRLHNAHLIINFHTTTRESETLTGSRDQVLPDMQGGLRDVLSRYFDLFFYASAEESGGTVKRRLIAAPTRRIPAKVRFPGLEAKLLAVKEGIPNDFAALVQVLNGSTNPK